MRLLKRILRTIFTFFCKYQVGGYKSPLRVNFYSRFTKNTYLGENTNFNGLIIRGKGKVVIGNNFHSGKDILFLNSYHKYDNGDAIPYDSKITIDKPIIIKDNVWVGDRVTVLGGVTLEEGAIIQAGAVVISDVSYCAIVGGNPAKVFKYRDIEEYERLKKKGRFC